VKWYFITHVNTHTRYKELYIIPVKTVPRESKYSAKLLLLSCGKSQTSSIYNSQYPSFHPLLPVPPKWLAVEKGG
jgi:hypothetical protein